MKVDLREWLSGCCVFRTLWYFSSFDGLRSLCSEQCDQNPRLLASRGDSQETGLSVIKSRKSQANQDQFVSPQLSQRHWGPRGFPALMCHAKSYAHWVICRSPKGEHIQRAGWTPWSKQRVCSRLAVIVRLASKSRRASLLGIQARLETAQVQTAKSRRQPATKEPQGADSRNL